jgi:diguanylate cyclase (GGDEF)-like protein/PAS domain S-box-containing protein
MMDRPNNQAGQDQLSKEFFQNIFTQAGDGIFLIDDQGRMIEMNPRGCEILGYSRQDMLDQPIFRFQPPDEIDHIQKKLVQLAVDELVTTETAFIRRDGSRVSVEITGKLLSNNQILGLLRDITKRKRSDQALIESEQKFRSLVEHSPDGIVIIDETGRIIEWNRGQVEISGLKQSEALGRQIWDIQFQLMREELRSEVTLERLKRQALEILASGQGAGLNKPYETTLQLSPGRYRNVEVMTYTYQTNFGYQIGSVTRDITQRKQVEMLLEYLAMHDALTDLPNRQVFENRLNQALDRARRDPEKILAIMMLDLDNFKEVNDSYGHACGDELLKIIAQRLQGCLRKSDTAARMSGDEFALINEGVTNLEGVRFIANKVLETISNPVEIEGHLIQLTVSIGISLFSPSSVDTAAVLRQADMAMYQAKRIRNCYQFYRVS